MMLIKSDKPEQKFTWLSMGVLSAGFSWFGIGNGGFQPTAKLRKATNSFAALILGIIDLQLSGIVKAVTRLEENRQLFAGVTYFSLCQHVGQRSGLQLIGASFSCGLSRQFCS